MKKRFLCLLLAALMILPVSLLAGCGNQSTEEEIEQVTKVAEQNALTLTMFMITEKHVPTQDEVDALLQKHGENSVEYKEAKNTMDAYASVAAALDKITKAKFRTHLITTFYTEERIEGTASMRCSAIGDVSHLYVGSEEVSFSGRFCECFTDDTRH